VLGLETFWHEKIVKWFTTFFMLSFAKTSSAVILLTQLPGS